MVKTYTWPLPDGFNDGDMVTIKGSLPTGGSAFSINFLSGSDFDNSDIIFHMASRYNHDQIVFNTKNNGGNWMNEEIYNESRALIAGRRFSILIALQGNKFMITTNGTHFAVFNVRKSNTYIRYLNIKLDVNISSVTFETC
ncbi:putative galectin [Trypoxylus dichotomus]